MPDQSDFDEEFDRITADYYLKTQALGFVTPEAYELYKLHTAEGFIRFGDPFLRMLGEALHRAELPDAAKVITTWRSLCEQYSMMFRIFVAKREAEAKQNG